MKKVILYLSLIISQTIFYSQSTKPKAPLLENIQSPNAGSLGKYGDLPVSEYTGTPQIGIPIYKINEGNILLDINLQYDATGVRVNSVPGWVGQNWSLQAGGVITRTMRGRATDEFDLTRGVTTGSTFSCNALEWYQPLNCGIGLNQGYKNKTYELNIPNWSSTSHLNDIKSRSIYDAILASSPNYLTMKKNWQPDLEPDIFTFNFMGHTGKFFLGQDGQWKVSSSSNLKIICEFPDDLTTPIITPATQFEPTMTYPRIIDKITILDDNGNKFYFGRSSGTELTWPDFYDQKTNPPISSAWYLQSVNDKFGNQIYGFVYEKGPYIGHFYLNWGAKVLEYPGFTYSENNSPAYNTWSNSWDSSSIKAPGQLILPIYLKKIITKSGLTIELNSSISNGLKFANNDNPLIQPNTINGGNLKTYWDYDWDYFIRRQPDLTTINPDAVISASLPNTSILTILKWKKLDEILIKDKGGNSIMNVNLIYNNISSERLFLNEIVFNTDKKYNLEYNNKNLLPNFLSNAIDDLGYYNGYPFSFTPNASAFTFWRNYKNQRSSSGEHVKYGSLKKITYPTKGFTEFEFEPHTYSKEIDKFGNLINSPIFSSDNIIGGLRIKKIIDNDGKGNNYIKEYQYTNSIDSSISSGNLLFKPTYISENIYLPHGSANQPYFQEYTMKEININSMIPLTNLMGNTIEYETVIEKSSYFNNSLYINNGNGYKVTKYSNYSQFPDYQPVNSLVPDYNFNLPRTDRGFERGKVTEVCIYDVNNILSKKKSYLYQSNQNLRTNAIRMIIFDIYCVNCQTLANENIMSAYQVFYTDKYVIEEKEEIFNPSGIVSNTKKYSYKRYPEEAGSILNFGDLFKDKEYMQINDGGLLKTYKYPFDFSGSINTSLYNSRILDPNYEKTEKVIGNPYEPDSIELLSEKKINYSEGINGYGDLIQIPESILSRKGIANLETEFKYLDYSWYGALQCYKKENGIPISIIWGYNETKPIIKIENINYSEIPSNLISSIQSAINSGIQNNIISAINTLRTNNALSNTMITSYTYKNDNVSSITDSKGFSIFYEYDYLNRLILVKDATGNILTENQYNYKP